MEASKFFAIFIPILATIIVTLFLVFNRERVMTPRQKIATITVFIAGVAVFIAAVFFR